MIDPLVNKCTYCDWTFRITLLQRIRMLVFGDIVIQCPICHTRMTFRLIHHSVKVSSSAVKRNDLWRRG